MIKNRHKNQSGFTLIELIVTLVILSILMTITIIGVRAVIRSQREQAVKAKIMLIAEAQSRFKTSLGRGRYGSLCSELIKVKSGGGDLVQSTTVSYQNNNCSSPKAIGDWQIYSDEDSSVDTSYLKSKFSVYAKREGDNSAKYCLFEDRVLRYSNEGNCNRSSSPVN